MTAIKRRAPAVHSMADLLSHALVLESEATERYGDLADQMETHNNTEVAELFRALETIEKKHVDELREKCKNVVLPQRAPWEYRWQTAESPEALDGSRVHYLMTPEQACRLALEHERLASEFYHRFATSSRAVKVRKLAEQFRDQELEHVRWLEKWIAQRSDSTADQINDPDPPVAQE